MSPLTTKKGTKKTLVVIITDHEILTFGGSTVIISSVSGCFAARATMALHDIGFPIIKSESWVFIINNYFSLDDNSLPVKD